MENKKLNPKTFRNWMRENYGIQSEFIYNGTQTEKIVLEFAKEYANMEVEYNLKRLFDWLNSENREPANTKFTAGNLRNVASEIEYKLKTINESK